MQGVVPAAGEGTRMRPLTADRPKGLVEVGDRPLLSHVFGTLEEMGVSELVVVVGYRGEQIRAHYGDSFEGLPITYVTQENRRGLGHAVLEAKPEVDGEFVLLNGDNVLSANTDELLRRHRESGAAVSTLVETVSRERATRGGVFEREGDTITGLVEKPDEPPSTLVPRGIYVFSELIFPACELLTPSPTGEYELSAAVDLLLTAGHHIEAVPLSGWVHNVNTPADIEAVEQRL
jgi:dTDP-glucose pyrophosphorylase